MFSVEDFGQGF